jgi:tetratricopeptide (TPR) repeat protein
MADFSKAIEEYRRFISSSEDRELVPLAHDRIGGVYLSQKRYDEAIMEWEAAISKNGYSHKNSLRQLWIGDAFFSKGSYSEALNRLSSFLSQNTDLKNASRARMLCGRIYQEKNDHKKALTMFDGIPESLLAGAPFNEAQFFKARSYLKLGNTSKARILFDNFLSNGTSSPLYYDALCEAGTILILGAEKDYGLTMLEKARAESKKPGLKVKASQIIGNYYINENPGKAIHYLLEALEGVEPENKNELFVLIGKTFTMVKKYDKAVEYFDRYLEGNAFIKGRDEVNFLKAQVYLEKGDIEAALTLFDTIRRESPFSQHNAESGYYLAVIEYRKGNLHRSTSLLQEYLRQKTQDKGYEALILLTRIFVQKDDMENAGKTANILIRDFIDRKDVEVAIKNYAMALRNKGLGAQKYIDIIMTKFPESETTAELLFMFGNENFNNGNYEKSLYYYNSYLSEKYNTQKGDAFYSKLQALYHLKRYGEVAATIKNGNFPLMNEAQLRDIPLMQARSYFNMKEYDEAYRLMDIRNVQRYPAEDIMMYIKCALLVGDKRSAMKANENLVSDKQLFSESLYIIGDFFLKNDIPDQAEHFFSKILYECPETRFVDAARVSLGEIWARNEKYREAVTVLSEVNAKDVLNRKNSLLIACYFGMNMDEMGALVTREHLDDLLKSEYSQEVLKYNLNFFYRKKDLQQFNQYAKYLSRHAGNEDLINYLAAKINFESGNYYKSCNYFNALSKTKNRYRGESLYYLGMYNLLVNGNAGTAIVYFSRLEDMQDVDQTLRLKAMIHLAIIYRELKNNYKAQAYLDEVLLSKERGLIFNQASNLYEAFGYAGM